MIYLAIWMGLGIIAEALFIYGMSKRYPEFKCIDRDLIAAEIIIALIAGPIAFLALVVVLGSKDEE